MSCRLLFSKIRRRHATLFEARQLTPTKCWEVIHQLLDAFWSTIISGGLLRPWGGTTQYFEEAEVDHWEKLIRRRWMRCVRWKLPHWITVLVKVCAKIVNHLNWLTFGVFPYLESEKILVTLHKAIPSYRVTPRSEPRFYHTLSWFS